MLHRFRQLSVLCAIATVSSACSLSSAPAPTPLYQQEQFDTATSPYARTFKANSDATCEAARRALLSQGYVSSSAHPDTIDGSKNFQPSNDTHVVIAFHVVCADANADGTSSTAYVNAVQDRYALKKTSTSASVGLSVLGSLSLPIGSGSDSMVKIASETIPAGVFYERFFNLVDHFLKVDPVRRDRATVKAAEKAHVAPLPEPAPTHPGEPMKMTTPAGPTPPAPPVPVQPPAVAPAPAPALEPAPVPAAPSPSPTSRAPNGSPATAAPAAKLDATAPTAGSAPAAPATPFAPSAPPSTGVSGTN
ncbi:hypothetical protein CNE_BB1p07710 (plasmid) [Cupriavidus necator N-1]|uniref:DUF2242 domain-containing protein n=1 Tax=Cupriavidus necator (strain ATCC 43291 / DSM 13513 / CCUG 52238 / LMG 8453 / N-1) TaxID=1042878 RepID=F8GXW8_CUPNN|nr:DUF2242 domain-containing protein [Cupriavidus necator]AEI82188.1 hypothetical protein CNE_BB1p07710 [Cupriavidus necator N-1]MDX6007214.1 DUF2242 domain-containing protein [Cupriavidus necator]